MNAASGVQCGHVNRLRDESSVAKPVNLARSQQNSKFQASQFSVRCGANTRAIPHAREAKVSILQKSNPNLRFKVIDSADDLERCKTPYFSKARLISFLSAVIVPKHILDSLGYGAVNFHPGPPTYPGWAASNFAVYDGALSFGTTAHYMNDKIDTGEIIGLDLFEVNKTIEVNQLIDRAIADPMGVAQNYEKNVYRVLPAQ